MKVGITFSTFDLLHAGHIAMLREAKNQCDYLIVGLQSDPTIDRPDSKNSPIQTMFERYLQLKAVEYVDEIIPYQTERDLEDSKHMINSDMKAMIELHYRLGLTCDLSQIPLAKSKRTCRSRAQAEAMAHTAPAQRTSVTTSPASKTLLGESTAISRRRRLIALRPPQRPGRLNLAR